MAIYNIPTRNSWAIRTRTMENERHYIYNLVPTIYLFLIKLSVRLRKREQCSKEAGPVCEYCKSLEPAVAAISSN